MRAYTLERQNNRALVTWISLILKEKEVLSGKKKGRWKNKKQTSHFCRDIEGKYRENEKTRAKEM